MAQQEKAREHVEEMRQLTKKIDLAEIELASKKVSGKLEKAALTKEVESLKASRQWRKKRWQTRRSA